MSDVLEKLKEMAKKKKKKRKKYKGEDDFVRATESTQITGTN